MAAFGVAASGSHQMFIAGGSSFEEERALQNLVNESYDTLRSEEFRANLASISKQFDEAFVGTEVLNAPNAARYEKIGELADMVAAQGTYRYVYSPVFPIGGTGHYNDTTVSRTANGTGTLSVGRGHLYNWKQDNVVHRSCAVNSVAHELTHLISKSPDSFELSDQVLRDWGAGNLDDDRPVASYLLGTVAQCTWLQRSGYQPEVDIKDCVAAFGHRGFNGLRCTAYPEGSAVEVRADLPPPHVLFPDTN
ncbi:hypothetical protein [Erythrobacter litoralis]|uniref:hypothetical protein n=1 Tax=Erythrobacter litoralis TaxID=39960 RepID=UPI0012DC703C|nr:hypothetical protein [Erythrobacter litoralis]